MDDNGKAWKIANVYQEQVTQEVLACHVAIIERSDDWHGCGRCITDLSPGDVFAYLWRDGGWSFWCWDERQQNGLIAGPWDSAPQFCPVCYYNGLARVLVDARLRMEYRATIPMWAALNKATPVSTALGGAEE